MKKKTHKSSFILRINRMTRHFGCGHDFLSENVLLGCNIIRLQYLVIKYIPQIRHNTKS